MKGIQGALQNKTVNDLTVAFIVGYSVVNFVWSVGQRFVGNLFNTTAASYSFKDFLVDLIVLAVALLVADWVSRQSR